MILGRSQLLSDRTRFLGYAILGNVIVSIPEWDGQKVQIKLEQDAAFNGKKVSYLAGRQIDWHFVRWVKLQPL